MHAICNSGVIGLQLEAYTTTVIYMSINLYYNYKTINLTTNLNYNIHFV